MTIIGESAFENCSSLRDAELPEGVNVLLPRVFKHCKNLSAVSLPPALTGIGKEAFRECISLATIDLGKGVTTIGDNALRETAITTLVLPETVTVVGKKVAEKCKNLNLIQCHAVQPPKLEGVSNNKVELQVPDTSVQAYKSAKNWKNFKNIDAISVVR